MGSVGASGGLALSCRGQDADDTAWSPGQIRECGSSRHILPNAVQESRYCTRTNLGTCRMYVVQRPVQCTCTRNRNRNLSTSCVVPCCDVPYLSIRCSFSAIANRRALRAQEPTNHSKTPRQASTVASKLLHTFIIRSSSSLWPDQTKARHLRGSSQSHCCICVPLGNYYERLYVASRSLRWLSFRHFDRSLLDASEILCFV